MINCDSRNIPFANNTFQCCITSPPYFRKLLYSSGHQEIGIESDVDAYLSNLVLVFRDVKRVLKDDGVCVVNIDDTRWGSGKGLGGSVGVKSKIQNSHRITSSQSVIDTRTNKKHGVFKPKDWCLVPERFAIKMQEDGWYVRMKPIWSKTNGMPYSGTDALTHNYENIYVFTKDRFYYWDKWATATDILSTTKVRYQNAVGDDNKYKNGVPGQSKNGVHNARRGYKGKDDIAYGNGDFQQRHGSDMPHPEFANMRDVIRCATARYRGTHFATYPVELIAPFVEMGSKVGDLIIDPFGGVGTTEMACNALGRKCVSLELNHSWCVEGKRRIKNTKIDLKPFKDIRSETSRLSQDARDAFDGLSIQQKREALKYLKSFEPKSMTLF